MAWTAPATFSDGSILTAAQLNAMRDNFNETAPAKATAAGGYIVSNGVNSVVQRDPNSNTFNTATTSTSTSYVDLTGTGPAAGPVVSGTRVIVWFTAQMNNNTVNTETICSVAVSGTTTIAADDNYCIDVQQPTTGTAFIDITACRAVRLTVTAGSNTYTMNYRVTAGTGSWRRRSLVVLPA
jgi:hypothetical protein